MKPIQLTWSGLQSYREKQEIDFTRLCDAGVFGIFGPTGSGKSTILDAMTLALYGKVERASKGTQGILNHAESIIAVSFTFELSHADGARRYRVERQYKRSTDVSVTNSLCRLIQIETGRGTASDHVLLPLHSNPRSTENIVLADKVGEVDALIQQILGLSMQDFSRAVVLPQGKFAEFLALKGTDRRQMLQRLFHLEHYGDELNLRVSQRTKETDLVIKQLAAEQMGLGDASEQAVLAAESQLQEARQLALQERIKLNQAEQHWQEQKQLHTWQQEKESLEKSHAELRQQSSQIAEQEQRLKSADQAGRIYHFLQEVEHANQHALEVNAQLEQVTQYYSEAAERYSHLVQKHAIAKDELNSQDAVLQVKVEQLKQAVLAEQDIQKGQLAENVLVIKLEQCNEQWHMSQLDLQKKQDVHKRALDRQQALNEQLKQVEVKSELRQLLQNALRDKHVIDTAQLKADDLIAQTQLHQQIMSEEILRDAEITEQQKANQAQQRMLMHTANKLAITCTQADLELQSLHHKITVSIDELKEAEKTGEILRFASHLAGQLQHDQPCPVCGSAEHPNPVSAHKDEDDRSAFSASELEKLQVLLTQTQQMQFKQQRQSALQHDLQLKLTESMAEMDAISSSLAEVAVTSSIVALSLSPSAEDLEKRIKQLEGKSETTAVELHDLTEDIKQLLGIRDRLAEQQIRTSAQRQAKESVISSLQAKAIEAEAELRQKMQQWQLIYHALNLETIIHEAEKLTAMDHEADQLRARLQTSVPFIEEALLKIQEQTLHSGELEKQRIQLETEVKGQVKLNLDAKQQFMSRWGSEFESGGTIAERIQQTEQHLQQLRQHELETRQQMEQFLQELQRISEQNISLRHANETAKLAQAKAEQFWQQALEQTSFKLAEEVRNALLSTEQIQAWQMEVKQHREQELRLSAKLEEIQSKLQNRVLLETEWLEAEHRRLIAREADEAALQSMAKVERDLEQLQSKHSYWTELQTKLLSHQVLHADLIKLQSVLRGNAFVEYLAEEQLIQVSRVASERLGQLTRQRYALEVDSSGGFIIRDDANGGVKRPVGTLSGGETFLTSLALALALSAQIQLSGQYPLEFFFLDEGFGTLDPDLLETVVDALEKLHIDRLTVGVISHVPELKARLPRKLIVQSAEPGGRGSRVYIESL